MYLILTYIPYSEHFTWYISWSISISPIILAKDLVTFILMSSHSPCVWKVFFDSMVTHSASLNLIIVISWPVWTDIKIVFYIEVKEFRRINHVILCLFVKTDSYGFRCTWMCCRLQCYIAGVAVKRKPVEIHPTSRGQS